MGSPASSCSHASITERCSADILPNAYAENPQAAAGVQVDHLALQFACPYAVRDAETKFRTNGNRLERSEIATSRAQFHKLCANQGFVFQSNFGIGKEREARIGTLLSERNFSHDVN